MNTTISTLSNQPDYINHKKGIMSWLLSTDHKRIGILYLVGIIIFFLFGMLMALLMRLELLMPGKQFFDGATYNHILTLHGVVMIFLFIIPGIPAVFGNFFLPILIGAKDVAFPRLNLASWYFYVAGGAIALYSVVRHGGPDTGWTFYVPFVMKTQSNVYVPLIAAFTLGWSSILTGLNFVTTIHRMRAPGVTWFKLPLFTWSLYATAWVQLLATPVVAITLIMVILERGFGLGIFDPTKGGDPLLYQHLFWIYSHPAVYIMILPAMGVISEIIPTFCRKTIFGYKFIAVSSILIASIGSLVWAHHMFTSGMSDQARIIFSFLTFLVAVPSAIKVFNWLATMYRGSIQMDPPMIWAMIFIFLFAIGGLTGLINGALSTDIHIHDTANIVGHFHYTMFGGTASMFFGGLLYWFPKMFGRMYNKKVIIWASGLFFIGFNMTYFSLLAAGIAGMPRRYADYLPQYEIYHRISTYGSWLLASSLLIIIGTLIHGLLKGKPALASPWGGKTLEWQITSPPPPENFDEIPVVTDGPYDYPVEVAPAPNEPEVTHV